MQADKHSERQRLLQMRQTLDPALARQWSDAIASHLDGVLSRLSARHASVYMPIRSEPDLTCHYPDYAEKRSLSLPLCDENGQLRFISWVPGQPLVRGRYDIPVPANGAQVIPDAVVVPCVGFTADGFRLGYGGGWFDRTLPDLPSSVRVIGVAYGFQASGAFTPEAHDRPMHCIVTEAGVLLPPAAAASQT